MDSVRDCLPRWVQFPVSPPKKEKEGKEREREKEKEKRSLGNGGYFIWFLHSKHTCPVQKGEDIGEVDSQVPGPESSCLESVIHSFSGVQEKDLLRETVTHIAIATTQSSAGSRMTPSPAPSRHEGTRLHSGTPPGRYRLEDPRVSAVIYCIPGQPEPT